MYLEQYAILAYLNVPQLTKLFDLEPIPRRGIRKKILLQIYTSGVAPCVFQ